jgi:hypothetical protein
LRATCYAGAAKMVAVEVGERAALFHRDVLAAKNGNARAALSRTPRGR